MNEPPWAAYPRLVNEPPWAAYPARRTTRPSGTPHLIQLIQDVSKRPDPIAPIG